jgi:hypothetical protein
MRVWLQCVLVRVAVTKPAANWSARRPVSLAHQPRQEDPAKLWSHYLLLVAIEEAFKNLKATASNRPIFHQLEARVEAHVFIAFLAYCLQSLSRGACMRLRRG